jgi:[pyruvate, water dikinase]-phosphate phosphotransferase / [pyruvate, water dikinase] kinase
MSSDSYNNARSLKIIVISDGTGETATQIVRAVMTQFSCPDIFFTRYKNVRDLERLEIIFQEAAVHHDLIVYTIVEENLRNMVTKLGQDFGVRTIDILGPSLQEFSVYFNQRPKSAPGLLYAVDENYFKRVAAMEFTLNNDDGKNIESLQAADVILVGVSRTSKTPLSVYLSQHGIKVVNIPLIQGTQIPETLFEVDQKKIFALTIDPQALIEIRKNRLSRLGQEKTGDYATAENVLNEVEWANDLFKQHRRWPVFDVTNKAIEEIAAEIMRILRMRNENFFKQAKNKI